MTRRFISKNQGTVTLTHPWYVAGTLTDVGDVTVDIVDERGNTIVSDGATVNTSGTYTYDLANQDTVRVLYVTWTADTASYGVQQDVVEVVGSRLFTEEQARAFDSSTLSDTTTYADADLLSEEVAIAGLLERMTGRSWVRRYRYMTFGATGGRLLYLASAVTSEGGSDGSGAVFDTNSVLSASVSGTSVTTGNIKVDRIRGTLYRTDGSWGTTFPSPSDPYPVAVEVEYGAPALIDGVDRIALLLLRDRLVSDPTDFGGRTQSLTTELGFYRIDTLPVEVREWVKDHDYRSRF